MSNKQLKILGDLEMDKNYWAIHFGEGNKYASLGYEKGFIAVGWNELNYDLSPLLQLDQQEFINKIKPRLEAAIPKDTKMSRAQTAGQLYRFANLAKIGDIVLMPKTDEGKLYIGEISGEYIFVAKPTDGCKYRHRRTVTWVRIIELSLISQTLKNAIGSIMTFFNVSSHMEEVNKLIPGEIMNKDSGIQDLKEFGMESHLEDFIIDNWGQLSEFNDYEIVVEDRQIIGQQYITPIGRIDILARSKNGKEWLVIELKKGKTADEATGQILRYMGWVKKNLAEENETIIGVIISGKNDERLDYALNMVEKVKHFTYKVNFKLEIQ